MVSTQSNTHGLGDTFKIGNFGAAVQSTNPISFDVPIEVVDQDGDAAASSIGVTLAAAENIHDYSASLGRVTATAGSGANPEPHIIGSNFETISPEMRPPMFCPEDRATTPSLAAVATTCSSAGLERTP